ncbi:MAG: hypothetical protein IJZ42_04605 [Lachnospiraceae bacterium]|nr:hypothetical protein [Lachnospiraceae bacterium]
MAEKGKGSFGYLKKQAVKQGLFALSMLAVCATIFLIGFFWLTQFSTILTVISVLGMLPVAKFIVSMILFMKAEKFSCDVHLHEEIIKIAGNDKERLLAGFDFYLTSYDKNFPLSAACVAKDCFIAYTPWEKCDCNKCKEHFEEYMKKNSISGIVVKIFTDEKKYLERFAQLCEDNTDATENERAMYRLLLNLSL